MKDLRTNLTYSDDGIEVELTMVEGKDLTSKERNNLPDSDFAYIEPGGKKVDGKTEPRSLRKFPIQDAAHVRSALSYLGKSNLSPEAKKSALKKIKIAAKKFGVTVSDSDGKTKEEWDKIDKKELKRDTKKEKEKHEKDAVEDDTDRIKKLKKGEPSEKKKAEIRDLKKDQKRDKKTEKEIKGAYNKEGEYVPYEGAEPNPAVQYRPVANYNKKGEYVPYEGKEPNPAIQYVPENEVGQHKSFMSECMANDGAHTNTEGLDEGRANLACALAYDNKFKTAYAPCTPDGVCVY